MWIRLPEDDDNLFHLCQLIRHLIANNRDYIIQGQQQVALNNHTKASSLDYWIRDNIAEKKDTAQATNMVIAQICQTGLFQVENTLVYPETNRLCKGIRLFQI